MISLEISEQGRSGGVIFVETEQGAFVLKASNEAAQDYFYNQLAIELGLDSPTMLVLGCYET